MKQIKDNPTLALYSLQDKIKTPFNSLIVAPALEKTAYVLFDHFIYKVLKFKKDGKELTAEEAIRMNLVNFKIIVEIKLKEHEWLLITEDEIYYSKGDNSC